MIGDLRFMIEGSFPDREKYQDKQIAPIAKTKTTITLMFLIESFI